MDHHSQVPHGRNSPCKGLLLTASIFSCWIQPTSAPDAPISIVTMPPYGIVGSNVTLSIQGFSAKVYTYSWYRKSADVSNQIITYSTQTSKKSLANIREIIFNNGSLLIPNLTLSDNDDYIVQIVDSEYKIVTAHTHLEVYAFRSRGIIEAGIFVGVVTEVALIVIAVYILCIRKAGRDSQHTLGDLIRRGKICSFQKEGEDCNLYMNNTHFPQIQNSSFSSADPSENIYQALEVTEVDIYDKIMPQKKPYSQPWKGKITKS
ncbi:carcinoembryonic antigen-related cell adhesion molecule 3-like isoform X2 [Antechinus flavipes]|uniref:carcinoembryonic antigen-related cell adhesion molecule 3-like isoform X2 n=1 Tax=Antechinus flavipes TaxID=38775 RepID=UPI002236B5EA|nr:carcinoembryonic antigen-related cell adhesion molecule 3-like isoform X2 [Antechinus flavipes]